MVADNCTSAGMELLVIWPKSRVTIAEASAASGTFNGTGAASHAPTILSVCAQEDMHDRAPSRARLPKKTVVLTFIAVMY